MSTGRLGAGDNAIQSTLIDAKGDLVTATAADTPARLAVGSNGQYLKADSTAATGLSWATLPASGKVLQVVQDTSTTQESTGSTSFVDTNLSQAITPSSASSKVLVMMTVNARIQKGSDTYIDGELYLLRGSTGLATEGLTIGVGSSNLALFNGQTVSLCYLDSPNTTSSTTYKIQMRMVDSSGDIFICPTHNAGGTQWTSTLTLLEIGA